jgi:hypothetical protein
MDCGVPEGFCSLQCGLWVLGNGCTVLLAQPGAGEAVAYSENPPSGATWLGMISDLKALVLFPSHIFNTGIFEKCRSHSGTPLVIIYHWFCFPIFNKTHTLSCGNLGSLQAPRPSPWPRPKSPCSGHSDFWFPETHQAHAHLPTITSHQLFLVQAAQKMVPPQGNLP